MNNQSANQFQSIEFDHIDFSELEKSLEHDLSENLEDLKELELDATLIDNPDSLGETVKNVIWEQFINQLGVDLGKDFINKNYGLTLDLRDSAHIQTTENFKEGLIATHNHYSKDQLEKNHDRYKNTPHKVFRREYVNPNMDEVLPRSGTLKSQGQDTVRDIYTGRQIPTQTRLEDGSQNPLGAQREHVKSSDEIYHNPTLQMGYDNESLAAIINHPDNLQGYTTAERNNRKSNLSKDEMGEKDKNKHWEKANDRAEKLIQDKEQEAIHRLESEGKKTQKEEAFKITGTALRAVLMGLLAALVKEIIRNIVTWFKSANRQFKTFLETIKEAILNFIKNLKQHLLTAGNTLVTTIATAIVGPVFSLIKKAWIFLKQGYKSVKDAIEFLKNPANKNKPFSLKLLEVGKILIAGLTAAGAIVLGEVIEKGLLTIPAFAIQIPLLGSLASLLGIFFGAIVSGIVGALAINLINRLVSRKLKEMNIREQVDKKNNILSIQNQLLELDAINITKTSNTVAANIYNRHQETAQEMSKIMTEIEGNSSTIEEKSSQNSKAFEDINNLINNL